MEYPQINIYMNHQTHVFTPPPAYWLQYNETRWQFKHTLSNCGDQTNIAENSKENTFFSWGHKWNLHLRALILLLMVA